MLTIGMFFFFASHDDDLISLFSCLHSPGVGPATATTSSGTHTASTGTFRTVFQNLCVYILLFFLLLLMYLPKEPISKPQLSNAVPLRSIRPRKALRNIRARKLEALRLAARKLEARKLVVHKGPQEDLHLVVLLVAPLVDLLVDHLVDHRVMRQTTSTQDVAEIKPCFQFSFCKLNNTGTVLFKKSGAPVRLSL